METESRTLLLSALLKIGPPPTRRCTGRERVDIMDVRVDLRQYCRNAYSHTIECRIGTLQLRLRYCTHYGCQTRAYGLS
jgi:hypothetical protein